jgi:hypothetical protein
VGHCAGNRSGEGASVALACYWSTRSRVTCKVQVYSPPLLRVLPHIARPAQRLAVRGRVLAALTDRLDVIQRRPRLAIPAQRQANAARLARPIVPLEHVNAAELLTSRYGELASCSAVHSRSACRGVSTIEAHLTAMSVAAVDRSLALGARHPNCAACSLSHCCPQVYDSLPHYAESLPRASLPDQQHQPSEAEGLD